MDSCMDSWLSNNIAQLWRRCRDVHFYTDYRVSKLLSLSDFVFVFVMKTKMMPSGKPGMLYQMSNGLIFLSLSFAVTEKLQGLIIWRHFYSVLICSLWLFINQDFVHLWCLSDMNMLLGSALKADINRS